MSTIKFTGLKTSLLCVAILAASGVQAETQTMPTECTADTPMAEGCMNHGQMNHQGMNHGEMNHGQMNHQGMNHGEMNHGEMNHGEMNHGETNHGETNHGEMNHGEMNHGEMNHGEMNHDEMNHGEMNHGEMNHGEMNHGEMNHGEMNHGEMNHGEMNHGEMNHGEMNHGEMNHGGMNHQGMNQNQMNSGQMAPQGMQRQGRKDEAPVHQPMNHQGMGHTGMPMSARGSMDHEGMNHDMSGMQGGSAPANARDPHAYSGGYTLTSGPYAMEGPRQLVLADEHIFSSLMVEKLGISREDGNNTKVTEGEFWVGTTWDRLAVGFDADHFDGETEWRVDANWRHAITAFWNTQLGVRHDDSEELDRNWVGLGFQGLAPYWFESEAMLYIGEEGVTQLELKAEYDILLTQRWIVSLEGHTELAGKADPEGEFGRGINSVSLGPTMRYEFSRQFAPYIGAERSWILGDTEDLTGEKASLAWNAGVRLWF